MYEYKFVRINARSSRLLGGDTDSNYLSDCESEIKKHAQCGWRYIGVLRPDSERKLSKLVFERPVESAAPSETAK